MGYLKMVLFFVVMVCLYGAAYTADGDLGAACKADGSCTSADHVCDGTDTKCKVKANGEAEDCADTPTNCPAHATCSAKKCNCNTGYKESAGLCTVIGTTCTTDSDCSTLLTNSVCQITSPCTKGTCQCSSGYSGDDCLTLGNGKTCDSSADKCDTTIGLHCSSSTCTCSTSGHTYQEKVGTCTDKKVFGQDCSTGTDCHTTTNGGCNSDKCSCDAGYIEDPSSTLQSCRKPFFSEACTSTVGCEKASIAMALSTEGSEQSSTCSSTSGEGTCECASTIKDYSAKTGSVCYKYCLTANSGDTKADSQECTSHNQCTSKLCLKCPDDTAGKCYSAPCSNGSGMKKTERKMILLSFILLLAFIF